MVKEHDPALGGMVSQGGPKIILERPDHAKFLGAIVATWGEIDQLLTQIFDITTFGKPLAPAYHSRSELSWAVFEEIKPLPTRIKIIKAALADRYNKKIQERFKFISSECEKSAKSRNDIVHCAWNISDLYPSDLVTYKNQKWIIYTSADFEEILDSSVKVRNSLNDFSIELSVVGRTGVDRFNQE